MLSPDFAVLAAVLPLAGFASYLRDTLQGKTQPNRVSWSLWATAPLIAFAAELAERTSLNVSLLTFALGAGPALILAASFACPRAYWAPTRLDLACGAAAVAALIGWAVTRRGDVAIALAITADTLAAVPTIRKAWAQPGSESVGTYAASGAGSAITLLTITHWRFASFAFPLYVTIVCGAVAALIALPHARSKPVSGYPASPPDRSGSPQSAPRRLGGASGPDTARPADPAAHGGRALSRTSPTAGDNPRPVAVAHHAAVARTIAAPVTRSAAVPGPVTQPGLLADPDRHTTAHAVPDPHPVSQ